MGMPLSTMCDGKATLQNTVAQPASMFIDYALTWIDQQLEDPQKFPVRLDGSIRPDFEVRIAKPIFTILFSIICHIYDSHFAVVESLGQTPHLNSLFAHFSTFSREFDLVSGLDLGILESLQNAIFQSCPNRQSADAIQ